MEDNSLFLSVKLPKPLLKEEFINLLILANKGNINARNKILVHNIKLVIDRVFTTYMTFPYEKSELVSVGMFGLIKALDSFDVSKGYDFSTYATRCIDHEIINYMNKFRKYLDNDSLNRKIDDEDKTELGELLKSEEDFVLDYEEKELLKEIRKQVNLLEGIESKVVKLYFGFIDDKRYTQREIGSILGISKSYVSLVIKNVLNKIEKNILEDEFIERMSVRKRVKSC